MIIDPAQIDPRNTYQLLIGSIVPRPIAWVSTIASDGTPNVAPFSFFMGVTGNPPTLAISSGSRRGTKKDTLVNVEKSGELVVNIVSEELGNEMNLTSGEFPPDVDEFQVAGLTPIPSQRVRAPRVAESPINIECVLKQVIYIGNEGSESGLIIAEAVLWHVRDDLLTPQNTIDVSKLHAIGRLSGNWYTRTQDLFEITRPASQPPKI
ncbi:flavin reductase family protein [Calothrix sp. PCC 7507]|uniref:flavin reductase family protein n=1 Tax=Calothrix sp. PCC 7507 TaxID=99598 RepID=UPI00029EC990|nr:flavin reductase family protein [Calothrix sp. PCC 7507]AFY31158.1 flavin reductase domain protein FMN-binding protein [Calothrix sp. PCC 7507]